MEIDKMPFLTPDNANICRC